MNNLSIISNFYIFEYSESSIHDEILHQQKSKKFFTKSRMRKIFEALAQGVEFIHNSKKQHSDLRTENIFKSEQGDYKLLPPKIKPREKGTFYFYSPEEYQFMNFRQALDRQNYDKFKAEIFSLGMLVLRIGTFHDFKNVYGKFDLKQHLINEGIELFESMYGFHMAEVIRKCLNFDPVQRLGAQEVVLYLQSPDLKEKEKEILKKKADHQNNM